MRDCRDLWKVCDGHDLMALAEARHLLAHGWEACPDPDWDLQYQSTFLIAATEQSGTRINRTFVGLSGPAPDLKNLALDAGFILTPF